MKYLIILLLFPFTLSSQILGEPITNESEWVKEKEVNDTSIVYWTKNDEKYIVVDSILTRMELTYPKWVKDFYMKEFKSNTYRRISKYIFYHKVGRYYAILYENSDKVKIIFTKKLK